MKNDYVEGPELITSMAFIVMMFIVTAAYIYGPKKPVTAKEDTKISSNESYDNSGMVPSFVSPNSPRIMPGWSFDF